MTNAHLPIVPILPARPRILFVGINPGLGSAARGHNFAGPGNPFWRLLHAAGLTPVPLQPEDEARLAAYDCGLVNLCDRPTRTAAELTGQELGEGRARLIERVRQAQPQWLALVGVTLFPAVFPGSRSRGPGLKVEKCAEASVFVLPNPSGLNASFPSFDSKLVWFRRLAELQTTGS